jgi:flagellar FliL protein
VFLDVPDILVNLASNPGERIQYLKVKAVLELKEAPLVEKVKPAMPRVTDLFQTYLRELRPSDINGSAGLFRLKEELTKRVNNAVAPHQVSAVLFKEIVVQ